jgi:hypothetical protein
MRPMILKSTPEQDNKSFAINAECKNARMQERRMQNAECKAQ